MNWLFNFFIPRFYFSSPIALLAAVSFLCVSGQAQAVGYLEMPETTQVPELKKDSMLLNLDVPPLRDRDPNPSAGPRLNVKEFRLQGLVEYPELGITRQKLIERVEKIRFEMMRQDEIGEWGYTEEEVSEIADLMGDIESNIEDEHVGTLEVQRLVFLVREQRRKRGITVGMIETVADEITRFYREKGFILAKAYIPQQKVRDGVVTLTMLLGELGSVSVSNSKRPSNKLIERAFKPYIDQPVTSKRLEQALFLVNDIPGLAARSALSPGKQVGDTHLTVNIQSERAFDANIKVDTYGSETTSRNRFYGDVYWNNPTGMGDQVYLALLQTFSPDNSLFGALRYSSFWGMPRLRTAINLSTNEFVSQETQINSDDPRFNGESQVLELSADYFFTRLRTKNLSAGIKLSNIETEFEVLRQSQPASAQKAAVNFTFDILNPKRRQLYIGNLTLHAANTEDTALTGKTARDSQFLSFDVSVLSFLPLPFTDKNSRLLLSSSGQYAGESLSSILQFNTSGIGRARAFGVSGPRGDDGFYLGVDWFLPFPSFGDAKFFGQPYERVFQPYVYFDSAYGNKYKLNDFDDSVYTTLANTGVGLKINYGRFSANIFASSVLEDKTSGSQQFLGTDISTPTNEIAGELSYRF